MLGKYTACKIVRDFVELEVCGDVHCFTVPVSSAHAGSSLVITWTPSNKTVFHQPNQKAGLIISDTADHLGFYTE